MNYIYDIYLNFNNILYDFFEWNRNDKLTHLKKIPVIKVDSDVFKKILSYKIKVDKIFLNKIKYKTEVWKEKNNIKYCALFCTNSNILAIKFDDNGLSYQKSLLFIDEELEILDSIRELKNSKINFKILIKDKYMVKTRFKLKMEKFISNELNNINDDKLKYIYYEYKKKKKNKYKMISDLKSLKNNNIQYKKLYNILKLISSSKK